MCSDKKSQEPSYKWPVMPAIVNTEDKQLSTPLIRRLCQDEKCQSTRCFKKKSPVRPKYKYDKNCQSGSSSEKENPDPKTQMIYEANEAPVQKWLKNTSLDTTSMKLSPRKSFKSSKSQVPVQMEVQMKVQMKLQSSNQTIERDI